MSTFFCIKMKLRFLIISTVLFSSCLLTAQKVFPYQDYLGHLKSFQDGLSRQVDYLQPIDVKYSENIIAYVDSKNDLFVYNGETKEKLSGMANDYKIGINLVAWNAGPILNVWENGVKQNLTYFGRNYEVSDSLVVFEDTRDNAIRVYYKGQIYDLYYSISPPPFPQYIGSNTIAFQGNGDNYYAFIAGKIQEIGVYNENLKFTSGANLLAFNDPFNQSFAAVFKDGVFDVEPTMVQNYKSGYDIIVYKDRNDNLKGYINGDLVTLSSFASFYEVYRNMVVWGENSVLYTYYNGGRYEIANYIPKEYKIRDGIVAFRNLNGGVSAFYNGQIKTISNLTGVPFEVNGNTIKLTVSKGHYTFFKNGKTFQQ